MLEHPPALMLEGAISMIFINNKYTRWYYNIINNSKSTQVLGYTERHHVIPRSLGGWTWSDKDKEKLSAQRMGRTPWNKGRKNTTI